MDKKEKDRKRRAELLERLIDEGKDELIIDTHIGAWFKISDEFKDYLQNADYQDTNILNVIQPIIKTKTITALIWMELIKNICYINNNYGENGIKRWKFDNLFLDYFEDILIDNFENLINDGPRSFGNAYIRKENMVEGEWGLDFRYLGNLRTFFLKDRIRDRDYELEEDLQYINSYLGAINIFYREEHYLDHQFTQEYIEDIMITKNYKNIKRREETRKYLNREKTINERNREDRAKLLEELIKEGKDELLLDTHVGVWFKISDKFSRYLEKARYGNTNILDIIKPIIETQTMTALIWNKLIKCISYINNNHGDTRIERYKFDKVFLDFFEDILIENFENVKDAYIRKENMTNGKWGLHYRYIADLREFFIVKTLKPINKDLKKDFEYICSYLNAVNIFYSEEHNLVTDFSQEYIEDIIITNNWNLIGNRIGRKPKK